MRKDSIPFRFFVLNKFYTAPKQNSTCTKLIVKFVQFGFRLEIIIVKLMLKFMLLFRQLVILIYLFIFLPLFVAPVSQSIRICGCKVFGEPASLFALSVDNLDIRFECGIRPFHTSFNH